MFEEIGFSKDYYSLDKKYIGSLNSIKDRNVFGFLGRKKEILEFDIILKNKKYKKGTELLTELFPLSGKLLNK
jgi:hypothetical protein